MKGEKLIRVNGVRAVIRHSAWMGWTVEHVMDGRHCSGSDTTLAGIRKGLHRVTSQETREKLRGLLDRSST